jgi:predicted exporter
MSVSGGARRSPRIAILIGLLAVAAISAWGWKRLSVDSTLVPLLPDHSEAKQAVLFLGNSSFASKAILWFRLRGDGTPSDLYAAADEAEKRLDRKLIRRVIHPPAEGDAMEDVFGLLGRAGELLNREDLAEVEKATEPPALRKRMRECFMQLARPEGSFMQQIIRKDPLGVSSRILNRLYALTNGLGYRVEVKNGRLVNPDGRQLMLVMETSTPATDLAGSKALVANLNQIAASAPPGVQIIPLGAQFHTEENQRIMQADTHFAVRINGIVFILLFLLVSRDWRVASVFLLPVASIAITIGLCALFHPDLSMMVIGVSMTMAGSAVDYGIFVYTAVSMGKDPQADMRRIRLPLIISHLTTLGVFLAFLFSSIPAYRQLGWLTSVSLVLSLLAALFLLPRLIRPGGKIMLLGRGMPLARWGKLMLPIVVIAGVLLLAAVFVSRKTNFDPDISRLDGVSPSVKQAESDFQKTWGRSDVELGMLVVSGRSPEQAEEANGRVYGLAAGHFKEGDFVSLSSFWPSAATRRANEARWLAFWMPQRVGNLRRDLAVAGEPYGFSTDAFEPFFQTLTKPPATDRPPALLSSIEEQFTARSGGDYQMLSFFPDTAENVSELRLLMHGQADVQIVSRRALGQAFADAALSETRLLVGVSAAFIVIFLAVLTRSAIKSSIIMLPAFVGLIAMLAVLAIMSLSMSVVTVVAAILVLALTSDYGVFATYAWENHEPMLGQGMASVHLCALTTVVGTTALIFTRHPALHLVGVSLTSGLLAGYATAFFVIPGIWYLLGQRKLRRAE